MQHNTMRHLSITLLLSLLFVPCSLLDEKAFAKAVNKQRPYTINNRRYYPITPAKNFYQQGVASWYGPGFHNRKTANGEIYDMYAMTAAHTTLPMNTMLRVKNLENGRETVVRINDRGPFIGKRILDLSYAAAKALGMLKAGTTRVAIHTLATVPPPKKAQYKQQKREYYIQIGAFSNYTNARRLQKRLHNSGQKATIKAAAKTKRGKVLYLVQVYAGSTYQNAREEERKLLKNGYKGIFLISY